MSAWDAMRAAVTGGRSAGGWEAFCGQLPSRLRGVADRAVWCDDGWRREILALDPLAPRPSRVTFAGCFNAGKSTLVNVLLGQTILSSGDLPETGVLCEIRSGDATAALLRLRDGSAQAIEPTPAGIRQAAGRYLDSGRRNAGLAAAGSVEVTVTGALPGKGETWVDTPGIDDAIELDEALRAALRGTDLLVWVLAHRQLLSMHEARFLAGHLTAHGPDSLMLVLNAFLPEDTPQRWRAFTERLPDYRARIEAAWQEFGYAGTPLPPLVAVSARGALEVDQELFGVAALRRLIAERSRWDHPARLRHAVYVAAGKLRALSQGPVATRRGSQEVALQRQQADVAVADGARAVAMRHNQAVLGAETRFLAAACGSIGASKGLVASPTQADLAAPAAVLARFHTSAASGVRAAAEAFAREVNGATRDVGWGEVATLAAITARLDFPAVTAVAVPVPDDNTGDIAKNAVAGAAAGFAVGTFFPVIGNIVGTVGGGVAGALRALNRTPTVSAAALGHALDALAGKMLASVRRAEGMASAWAAHVPDAVQVDQRTVTYVEQLRALEAELLQLAESMQRASLLGQGQ